MGDLSRNFSRAEFACKCGCGFDAVSPDLVLVLQALRDHFAAPVSITSGCRCRKHNTRVGGAPASYHISGLAADITVASIKPREVYRWLDAHCAGRYGVIEYRGWVHVDVRPGAAYRRPL